MIDSLVHAVDHAHGQVGREVLGRPIVLGRRLRLDTAGRSDGGCALVGMQRHAAGRQPGKRSGQEALGRRRVHKQRLGRVAHAQAAASRSR